jgi:hypothetical protein
VTVVDFVIDSSLVPADRVLVKTSMWRCDKPLKIITLVEKDLQVGARGLVQYRYQSGKSLGATINRSLERRSVVIKMEIGHGPSVQILYGSIDLVKETGPIPHIVTVKLTGNESTMTCTVQVHIKGKRLEPVLLPFEVCLYKLKAAIKQVGRIIGKHASAEVSDSLLIPLIESATDSAKSFTKGLLTDQVQKMSDSQKEHMKNLLEFEPCFPKKGE